MKYRHLQDAYNTVLSVKKLTNSYIKRGAPESDGEDCHRITQEIRISNGQPFSIGPFVNTLQVVSLLPAYYQYSSASLLPTLAFPVIVHSLEFPSSPLHSPSGWPSHGPNTHHARSYGVLSPPLSDAPQSAFDPQYYSSATFSSKKPQRRCIDGCPTRAPTPSTDVLPEPQRRSTDVRHYPTKSRKATVGLHGVPSFHATRPSMEGADANAKHHRRCLSTCRR